jgi:hypothetical protein
MTYRFVKIAGLCLASMLALGIALAGTASAATPLWLLCLEGKEGSLPTKYESNQCTKAAKENKGKWESVALGNKSDTVRIVALSLRLEDTRASVIVRCLHVSVGIGLIEGRNLLLVRAVQVPKPTVECTVEGTSLFKACKAAVLERVEAVHLPWLVETYEDTENRSFTSRIQPAGAGEPGFLVECAGVEDTCVSEGAGKLEEVVSENVVTEGVLLVFGRFLKAHKANCSVSGAGTGEVEGVLATLLSNGSGLSLNL